MQDFFVCPFCGVSDIRHSHSRGKLDGLMDLLGRLPYRCRGCHRRFYLGELPPEREATLRRRSTKWNEA